MQLNNKYKILIILFTFLLSFFVNQYTNLDLKFKLIIEIILGLGFFSILLQILSKYHLFNSLILRINENLNGEINPYVFSIFRIIFGLLTFIILHHSFDFIEVVRYNSSPEFISLLKLLYYPTLLSIFFIIIGFGGRLPYLFNLIGSFYLHGDVGTALYMSISFWILFMDTDSVLSLKFKYRYTILNRIFNYSPNPKVWPSILLGLNVGFLITTAGISKLLDPVWLNGMGFYYTFLQPWIKTQHLNFILDYKYLMIIINWMTIITEIIVLPLMLFRRTRLYAGIFTVLMFTILTYPLRIDFIGPFGLLIGFLIIFSSINIKFKEIKLKTFVSYFPTFIYTLLIFSLIGIFQMEIIRGNITYPKLNIPFVLKNNKESTNNLKNQIYYNIPFITPISSFRYLSTFSLLRIPLGWYSPFNSGHFFGRIIYKVGIKINNEMIFPLEIFNDDGSMKTTNYSGRILYPRVLQNRIFALEMLKISVAQNNNLNNLPEDSYKAVLNLLDYYDKLFKNKGFDFNKLYIFYKNIYVPNNFEGNIAPCENQNWNQLFEFNIKYNQLKVIDIPNKMKLNRFEFPYFENNKIEPNPWYYE